MPRTCVALEKKGRRRRGETGKGGPRHVFVPSEILVTAHDRDQFLGILRNAHLLRWTACREGISWKRDTIQRDTLHSVGL